MIYLFKKHASPSVTNLYLACWFEHRSILIESSKLGKTTLVLAETVQQLGGRGPFHAPHPGRRRRAVPTPTKVVATFVQLDTSLELPPCTPSSRHEASGLRFFRRTRSGHRRCACAPVPHPARTAYVVGAACSAPARSGSPHRLTYLMIMAPQPHANQDKTAGRGARSTCLASVSLTAVGSAADPVPHIARARRGVPAGARRGDARCARRRSTQQVKGLCCPGQY